jgi:hypothetical protein
MAVPAERRDEADRTWTDLASMDLGTDMDDMPGYSIFEFDARGPLPIDRVQLQLPQTNTLARIVIQSSPDGTDTWVHRFDGTVYSLQVDGRTVRNPPVVVDRRADRYWRILVDLQGGGIGAQEPTLSVGWIPDRLLFVPRGNAPFVLAVGNANLVGRGPQSNLFAVPVDDGGTRIRPLPASLGEAFDLGGDSRLAKSREVSWEQVVLWGVLVLGVVLLAAFSLRLLRKTQSAGDANA